jgi:hypothetical protein
MRLLVTYTPRDSWFSYEESWYVGAAIDRGWIYFRLLGCEVSLYR